jgi:hypothetical protein
MNQIASGFHEEIINNLKCWLVFSKGRDKLASKHIERFNETIKYSIGEKLCAVYG